MQLKFHAINFWHPLVPGQCVMEEHYYRKGSENENSSSEKLSQSVRRSWPLDISKISYFTRNGYHSLRHPWAKIANGNDPGVGKGILVPIQKPGKKVGLIKSLRPLTLLPLIRKILANIFTNRSKKFTESYISPFQFTYRPRKSTTDVVWTMKWIVAKIMSFQDISVDLVAIDMSSAFDTIRRPNLINKLGEIASEDVKRMAMKMLSNTELSVRVGDEIGEPFNTNLASPKAMEQAE